MTVIGYVRVSSDKQDLQQQEHLLLKYAQQNDLKVSEFINIEISSRKGKKERRIDELMSRLNKGDILLVAELSRLGRNMFEVINIINELSENGVEIVFVRQPELSTMSTHRKLLLAIYSYFAEAERDFISMRTKQGLAAAKASGKKLGRPKGSQNKDKPLDAFREQIREYLDLGLSLNRVRVIINPQLQKPLTYPSYRYYVQQDTELNRIWKKKNEY